MNELAQNFALFRRRAVQAFQIVLGEKEFCGRIDAVREAERHVDVLFAEVRQPHARPQPGHAAVGFVDRLVDDVPGVDLAAVSPDDALDVLGHRPLGVGGAFDRLGPIRQRAIPDQRVPDHGHVVRLRKGEQAVGGIEAELRRRRPNFGPDQRTFRRDLLTIGLQRVAVVELVLQRDGTHASAVRDAVGRQELAHQACRRRTRRHGTARQSGDRGGGGCERSSARQHHCGPIHFADDGCRVTSANVWGARAGRQNRGRELPH